MIYTDKEELKIDADFLLGPDAEPIRKVAESLYPGYLRACIKKGRDITPFPLPVLDQDFMTSPFGRWARILAEVTFAEHVMKQQRVVHTVVFFGSARLQDAAASEAAARHPLARFYGECRELARRVTEWSLQLGDEHTPQPFIIATGGGPGIMEAGNRGAEDAGGKSIGFNITLPMEQRPNPYISNDLNFDFHYFFTRKFHFSYRAKLLVAFPGGFGTFDELFEIMTLIQTRKITKPCSIILYGRDFWSRVVDFKYLAECGVISPEDVDFFKIIDTVEEAHEHITKHMKRFLKP